MRAQTQLDFAVGVSIFLVVTAFVLSFVPGMLQPFESNTQQETVGANRVADQLVGGLLGPPEEPFVLDRACTVVFFEDHSDNTDGDGDYNDPFSDTTWGETCTFEDVPVVERVGLDTDPAMDLRVRLRRDLTTEEADDPDGDTGGDDDEVDTLCYDENNDRIVEANDPGSSRQCDPDNEDDVLFEVGGTPPSDTGSVVVARRTVSVERGFADNTSDASLIVEVW